MKVSHYQIVIFRGCYRALTKQITPVRKICHVHHHHHTITKAHKLKQVASLSYVMCCDKIAKRHKYKETAISLPRLHKLRQPTPGAKLYIVFICTNFPCYKHPIVLQTRDERGIISSFPRRIDKTTRALKIPIVPLYDCEMSIKLLELIIYAIE
jgi:hypothetical protein